ncbi:MAG: tRNA lysidine(34) synthetase TilS [Legionellales bacterium]|nr:tRNA lysidine(34) synthetase TilS [Legionellales bacterium]|tara:strand:+ start:117 stop:1349 length:1233 start_codon:yes stop_codon:yes gene_type:complete
MSSVLSSLLKGLEQLQEETIWVAFSGGVDSTVLLHALTQCHPKHKIKAIHVNHHLNAKSDDWAKHCLNFSKGLGVELSIFNVQVPSRSNIEALAREQRYKVFDLQLPQEATLLMAHHLNDQVETFFLKAFSGQGVAGLAGIPASRKMGNKTLLRPFLNLSKSDIEEYAHAHHLQWIEDDSNSVVDFDRNWIRHELMPLIESRFPGISPAIAKSQEKCLSAQRCLNELAKIDGLPKIDRVPLSTLAVLSEQRQKNLLIQWCFDLTGRHPSWEQLAEFLRQCLGPDNDAQLIVNQYTFRRWRHYIYAFPSILPKPPEPLKWSPSEPISLFGEDILLDGQSLGLKDEVYDVWYWRQGIPAEISPSKHHLKNRFQSLGIPPWLRCYIPLITKKKKLVVPIDKIMSYSPSWIKDS